MKNLKRNIILCAGIILTGLIAACSNPFTEPAEYNAGTGNVLISIAGGNGRTILPAATEFSRYELEVTGTGNKPTVPADLSGITGNGVSITLLAGEYTITVKAYRKSGNKEYLVAQGSKTVTVSSGHTAVVIDLKPFIGEEKGFFSYSITLPNDASVATLNLVAVDGSYDKEFDLLDSAASSAPIELSAGYYELYISLTKDTVDGGEYAVVHIYSGMETRAVIDLNNAFALINLETLTELVEQARAKLAEMEISDDGTDVLTSLQWVTQEAVNALNTALDKAQDVIDNPPKKQRPVNEARVAFEEALALFEAGIKDGTKDLAGLLQAIEDAKTVLANLKISTNGADVSIGLQWVPQASIDALTNAKSDAQDVADDSSSKQPKVLEAIQAIEEALAALTPKYGTQFANQSWTTTIAPVAAAPHIITPVTLNITSATVWTLAIPLAEIELTNGSGANAQSYSKENGVITFKKGTTAAPTTYATATLSRDGEELTVNFTLPTAVARRSILGNNTTLVLRKGTAAASSGGSVFSGVWTDPEGAPPRLSYISSDKWTFALPFDGAEGSKVNGKFGTFNRKAGFFKDDGTFYGVGEAEIESSDKVGNKLWVYPVEGGKFFGGYLQEYLTPFFGTWASGDATANSAAGVEPITGTLYMNIPFWSIEDSAGTVLVKGHYYWESGNDVKLVSNGKWFGTGTINAEKTVITIKVTDTGSAYAGLEQEFIVPTTNPFVGKWKGSIMVIVTVNATVTNNVYNIDAGSAGSGEGQYYWKVDNGVRRAYFFTNGYSYGVASMTETGNNAGKQLTVALADPISVAGLTTISSMTLTKQ